MRIKRILSIALALMMLALPCGQIALALEEPAPSATPIIETSANAETTPQKDGAPVPDSAILPEPSAAPSETNTPEATIAPEVTEMPEETIAPEVTETPEETNAPEVSVSPSPSSAPAVELTPSPSSTPEAEATPSPSPSAAPEASASPSPSSSPKAEVTPTPVPSATPEVSASSSPTLSPEASASPSPTPSPEASLTPSPSPSPSATPDVDDIMSLMGASFVVSIPNKTAARGSKVRVDIDIADVLQYCGGFTLDIEYDVSKLSIVDVDGENHPDWSSPLSANNSVVFNARYQSTNKCRMVYAISPSSVGNPPAISGTVLSIYFTVDANAAAGTIPIKVDVFEICDQNTNPIQGVGSGNSASMVVPPIAPTGLAVQSSTGSGVSLSWNAIAGVDGYSVFRGTTPSNMSQIDTASSPSYTDTTGIPGVMYYYVVSAWVFLGGSFFPGGFSNQVNAIVPIGTPTLQAGVFNSSTGTVALNWSAVDRVHGYSLFRGTQPDKMQQIAAPTGTSYTDSVVPGVNYYYSVVAFTFSDGFHFGGYSNQITVTTAIATPTLQPVSYSIVAGTITLSWSAIANVHGYAVYRGTTPDGAMEQITTTSGASFTENVTTGKTYYYCIRAYSFLNGAYQMSEYSNKESISTIISVPTLNSVEYSIGSGAIALSWSNANNVTGYAIFRGTSPSSMNQIATSMTTTYNDAAVTPGNTYYYTICSFIFADNRFFVSEKSNQMSVSTVISTPELQVANFNEETGNVSLDWSDVGNVHGFSIMRGTTPSALSQIATTGGNITTYVDITATPGISYYYAVYAFVYSNGTFFFSESSNQKTVETTIAVPTLQPVSYDIGAGRTTLNWSAVSNVHGYAIFRGTSPGGPMTQITTASGTSYTESVETGKEYYYSIKAYTYLNGSYRLSGPSNTESVSTVIGVPELQVASFSETTGNVSLDWSDVSNIHGYSIRRGTSPDALIQIATTGSGTTTFVDTTVTPGISYYYAIYSFAYSNGAFLFSESSNQKTVDAVITAPTLQPVSYDIGAGRAVLNWSAVSNVHGYAISRSTSPDGPMTQITTTADTSYTESVESGKEYYYSIRAYTYLNGSFRLSGYSNTEGVSTVIGAPELQIASFNETTGMVSLDWSDVSNIHGYSIRRGTSPDALSQIATTSSGTTTFVDTTVTPGIDYYYAIYSFAYSNGTFLFSESSNQKTVAAVISVPALQPVSYDIIAGRATLNWNAVTNVHGYAISRGTTPDGPKTQITTTSDTSYIESVESGKEYYYSIRAYTYLNGSFRLSGYSNTESVSTVIGTPELQVASFNETTGNVSLDWSDVSNIHGYSIRRGTSPDSLSQIAATGSGTTTFVDTTVTPGIDYYYAVYSFAYTNGGYQFSESSNQKTVTAAIAMPTLQTAAYDIIAGRVTLNWNAVSNVHGYAISRSTSPSGLMTQIATTSGTSYTESVEPGKEYYYCIRAYTFLNGSFRLSEHSNTKGVSTVIGTPELEVAVFNKATGNVSLDWSDVSNIHGYSIRRGTSPDSLTQIAATGSGTTTFVDTTATPGIDYYYAIYSFAYINGGYRFSESSNQKIVQTSIAAPLLDVVTYYSYSTRHITLNWNAIPNVLGYAVYRSTSYDGPMTQIATIPTNSYTEDLASPGIYYYRIRAYTFLNGGFCLSEYSNVSDAYIE